MTPPGFIGWTALGVVFVLLFLIALSRFIFNIIRGSLDVRIAADRNLDDILMKDLAANSFGLESKGIWQGRGNGALVLTNESLHFYGFVRGADLHLPLSAITDLSITKRHLGKRTLQNLLKVQFSVDGRRDSIAWSLTDAKAWKSTIEVLIAERPSREGQ